MPRLPKRPSYLLHRPSGRAYSRIGNRCIYLGPWDSTESRQRYADLCHEWATANPGAPDLTVDDLSLRYVEVARAYYRKGGRETHEVLNVRLALRFLVQEFGATRARDFGPKALTKVRDVMVKAGLVRRSCNQHTMRIRRVFKWAAAEELLPATVHQALTTVAPLKAGRSAAAESDPVLPVPEAFVEAVEPHVARQVWAMIRLQLLTGMRPGEVIAMRGCDLVTSGAVWEYVPAEHKTEHHGRQRTVYLGPEAQEIVRPFLQPDLEAYLFSPADAEAERRAARRAARRSKVQPSQRDRSKQDAQRRPGLRYDTNSYRKAVARGCEKAGVPTWCPSRLRHNAGTNVRRQFGIEAARILLGHAHGFTTEIYAERDADAVRAIAAKIG